jgi:transporter family-2 protein
MPTIPLSTFLFFISMAVLAGVATAFQPGVNARFAQHAGHPIHGGVINFAVGCVTMLLVWFIASRFVDAPAPAMANLAKGPSWMWIGGVLGAFFVTTAVFLVPRLGTTSYLTAMIAGQLVASLIIDRFGMMDMRQIPLSFGRIGGVLLVVAGVVVVKMSS